MTEQEQSLTYHSLYRHLQSIVPQYQGKDYPSIYSSNQQPHLPSILSRSRQKKSHEKSLKKGISRVSKSKQDLKVKQEQAYDKEILKRKSVSKGTLLNFNIQEVLDSKSHMQKPKDQILEKNPQEFTQMQTRRVDESVQNSNSKSFISEYRIVTYVPQGYKGEQANQMVSLQLNFNNQNLQNQNKQNSLNESNFRRGNQNKDDSEQIDVINPNDQHVLQLNTWRTSEYYDPYYSSNFRNQPNQNDQNPQDKPYSSFQYKYSVPLALQIHEKNESSLEVEQLKTKIKHLEHEIVEIQRQKTLLSKENQTLKAENSQLAQLHQSKSTIISKLQQNVNQLLEQIKEQQSEIQQYQQALNQINTKRQTFTQPHLPQRYQLQKNISRSVEDLQLLNAKISKQISQKNLLITDLNKKNKEFSQKVNDLQKEIRNKQQKIDNFEEKLSAKDQKIVLLSQEINRLTLTVNQQSTKKYNFQYNSLPMDKSDGQQVDRVEYDAISNNYDKLLRDFNHLEKKHLFMKDQLQHLKYLQNNGSSSTHTHRQPPKDQQPPNSNQLIDQYEQMVQQLQDRLEISERTLTQLQDEYSNLKQNFRALEELYIKQQNQSDEIQQQINRVKTENTNLKTEIIQLEQVFNAKSLAMKEQEESSKLLEKEEIIIALKRQLNLLDRTTLQLTDQVKLLQRERQEINQKYIQQVERNTQLSRRHKEDLTFYALEVEKQQNEKTSLIILKYQNLISKLNQEILSKKQQIMNLQDDREFQIGKLQERYKKEIERVRNEKKECLDCLQRNRNDKENSLLQSKPNNYTSLPYSRPDRHNHDSLNRKDETFVINLQQDYKVLEQKYKNLAVDNQRLEDDLRDNARKLSHLQKDLQFYKDYKDTSAKEKLQLCQQIERLNALIFQLKQTNCSIEDNKHLQHNQLEELTNKYILTMKENQSIIEEIDILQKNINDKNILLQNYEHDIRSLRIALLEEQQLGQKKNIQLEQLKEQKESHKSKEEYYKMLYEKTVKELEMQIKQKSLLLLNKQLTAPNPSPVKQKSPQKIYIPTQQKIDSNSIQQRKDRQTELYRLQIYKDLNKLLNMTSQTYTLEQIVQKNEQEYLRKLYNAIKEDHDKGLEFKQLIVEMEESFKNEKVHIKQDYDLVYEKYLKYKSMCQAMEKDIQKFKQQQFKKRDQNFASINI